MATAHTFMQTVETDGTTPLSRRSPNNGSSMLMKKRNFPPGVEPRHVIDLHGFLPYRIHLLATKIARPADITIEGGVVIRARDWRIILQLASRGPLTGRELSAMVGLDAATITRVVQRLGELGLVTTRVSSADRRKQIISLTEAGARAHDELAPGRKEVAEGLLECFSAKERKTFFTLLDRLEEHIHDELSDDDWVE